MPDGFALRGRFAVTDPDWLATLLDVRRESRAGAVPQEVNFWRPGATQTQLPAGTPFVFKQRGAELVAGYGFFSYVTRLPLALAWETFGVGNGVRSLDAMRSAIARLRGGDPQGADVTCVILSDVRVLAPNDRIAAPVDWHPNIVSAKDYDLAVGEGARVWQQLIARRPPLVAVSPLLSTPGGYADPALVPRRRGQGAFRVMVMDAYDRRCAVTGERTLPVLEGAHIRPFADEQTHEVRNGLLLRSDLHRLYDQGLVTVEPDLTFRVSRRIERDYSNGKIYYALDGSTIMVPASDEARPDAVALGWHASTVFRP